MKRITIRFTITLLTLLIGIVVAAFWIIRHQSSTHSVGKEEDCVPVYRTANSSPEDGWVKVLARFQEMPLESLPACVDESYRVIWVPAFHHPVAIRVWSSQARRYLVTKELDGKGGYGMGNLSLDQMRPLTEEEWFKFKKLLADASYWSLPSADSAPPPNDGAAWVIEGVEDHVYHDVHRRTPSKEFRDACVYLVELSGVKTEIERY
jgi:hypothetical protein